MVAMVGKVEPWESSYIERKLIKISIKHIKLELTELQL